MSERLGAVFEAFGWNLIILKYGKLQKEAFDEPGGHLLKKWIDDCPNQLYSALIYEGGSTFKQRILDDIGDQDIVSELINKRTDSEFLDLMANLGGHCVPTLIEAFENVKNDKPTAFIAYTIKGWGTPLAGHKDNHAGLMTKAQMDSFKSKYGISDGNEWHRFSDEKNNIDYTQLNKFLSKHGQKKFFIFGFTSFVFENLIEKLKMNKITANFKNAILFQFFDN